MLTVKIACSVARRTVNLVMAANDLAIKKHLSNPQRFAEANRIEFS
jgi:hypothetical protein